MTPLGRETTILYVEGCRDGTVGGSHTCLQRLVANLDRQRVRAVVVFYDEHNVARFLRSLGVEVHVFSNTTPLDLVASIARRAPRSVARLVRPAQQVYNFAWHFSRQVARCAAFIRRVGADVVHLNNSINTNHEWVVAARLVGVPVVSHERGISNHLTNASARFARKVEALICVSHAVRNALVAQGIDPAKASVIYDGVEREEVTISREPDQLRRAFSVPTGATLIGVLGNIKYWKGQETVVRALGLLTHARPDLRCLFVGSVADPSYKLRLDLLIDELGVRDQVIFTGFDESPWDFLHAMDIVIHSSVEPEPFGMVNLEAMCLGKAVIATAIGGPREVVDDGATGFLIPPGDPEALATRIAALLDDHVLRRRVGAAARVEVARRFRIADTVDQTMSVYRKLGLAV